MIGVCGVLYQPMMGLLNHSQEIRSYLQHLGFMGQVIFVGMMVLQVIFVFLPGEIIEILGGFLYGSLGGLALCLIGSLIGSSLIYLFVKKFGLRFVKRLVNIDRMNEMSFLRNKQKRNILCFIVFLIPGTPKDILTYFIPLTDMKLGTFLFITSIARILSIITSTIGGYNLGIENYLLSFFVFLITALISIIGIIIYKKVSHYPTSHDYL